MFAKHYAPWIGSISVILFPFLGAVWVARHIGDTVQLYGIMLGLLVSLITIIIDGINLNTLLTALLTIAAGWLGSQSGAPK